MAVVLLLMVIVVLVTAMVVVVEDVDSDECGGGRLMDIKQPGFPDLS